MEDWLVATGVGIEQRAGRAVALPDDTNGVVAVVNAARAAGAQVVPWWAASGGALDRDVPASAAGIVEVAVGAAVPISTERLSMITEVVPADLMAVVGAGVTCASLQERAAADGLYWPGCDVSEHAAMVGDVIARAPGNWTLAGNVLRRYTLGMEVVLADGQVLRTGSRTVKWVTGYDLRQLFIGSRGTLGVVTGLTLRLESLANREAVKGRYEREFAGLEGLGDAPWPAAESLPEVPGPAVGSAEVLELLKAELDPTGVFPPTEAAFDGD